MNFFTHQARARRNTTRLVVLFALAIASLIIMTQTIVVIAYAWMSGHPVSNVGALLHTITTLGDGVFWGIAASIITVVLLAWLYKSAQLSGGGKAIAEALEGKRISASSPDPDEQKVLNVVEEMAIASGTAVPPVYIIEEPGINAFAAGYGARDAVIGVTRGCIRSLNREELQGVIAHEFSHIFNGDMRLNIKLIAILHGIVVIGLIGHFLMRAASRSNTRSSRNTKGAPQLALLGLGLMLVGYLGMLFGGLIKAAVSRQREFLADASAVQYTRNPGSIGNALKKIGGYSPGSLLQHPEAEEMSHLFFNQVFRSHFFRLMATHPPLEERIRRVEPRWDGRFIKVFLSEHNNNDTPPQTALESVGNTTPHHLQAAQHLLQDIPGQLTKRARDHYDVQALLYCLLLDRQRHPVRQQQLDYLAKQLPAEGYRSVTVTRDMVFALAPHYRLPLMDIAITTLKQFSPQQYLEFKKHMLALIRADKVIDLMEWSLYRMVTHHLENKAATSIGGQPLSALPEPCRRLLSAVALASSENLQQAREGFEKGWALLSLPPSSLMENCLQEMPQLDQALRQANRLHPLKKPLLIKACCACLCRQDDPEGIELVRALVDGLDVPMPPLLANQTLC